jgi:RHH-type rel operon transcriptional repressor/antitoxin RelB
MNTRIQRSLAMATSIRLDPALESRLDCLAWQTGRTKAFYLREVGVRGLSVLEDYSLAAATLERVRKGEEKVHSAQAVRTKLGLDH